MRNPSHTTSLLRRTSARRGPLARAAVLIEFAFVLPIFLFLIIFSIDVGQLLLLKGAFQDATYAAARAGAQSGEPGRVGSGDSQQQFDRVKSQIPGISLDKASVTAVSPERCRNNVGADQVRVSTLYKADLATPGLTALLNLISGKGGDATDPTFNLEQTAVARCEITF